MTIRKAAVIGAGTMGSGIAGQFANAGVPVVLLDIVPKDAKNRNVVAEGGVARQLKAGGFMHEDRASLVTVGNLEDNLGTLADADWIVEAIVEDVGAKRDLYRRIASVKQRDAIVSSNTSTILRSALVEGFDADFRSHFAITHFFNPPRYMRLLEFVEGEGLDATVATRLRAAGESVLGKTMIDCRDTPGFIANRLGCYWMSVALIEALECGLTPEEADAVAGRPMGVPPTGIFGLLDLVGIDLIPNVWGSLYRALRPDDPFQLYDLPGNTVVKQMIEAGLIGRKAGGGFYRQQAQGGRKVMEVYDFSGKAYRGAVAVKGEDLAALCDRKDAAGRYAWRLLSRIVSYSALVAPEIAADVATIDTAMRLGYAWTGGPFELADRYGAARIAERLASDGEPVPELLQAAAKQGGFYADRGQRWFGTDGSMVERSVRADRLTVADASAGRSEIYRNASGVLRDIGDGLACLQFTTKRNVIDRAALDLVAEAARRVPSHAGALVIAADGPFSAGTAWAEWISLIETGQWSAFEALLKHGQDAYAALRRAPVPVVAAVQGPVLSGGLQLALHCDAVVAHAELAAALDEIMVGVIPAWGGTLRLLARRIANTGAGKGPGSVASSVFETIAWAKRSRSARYAQDYGYLSGSDTIVMNADQVFSAACARASELSGAAYAPPVAEPLYLAGPSGRLAIMNFVIGNAEAGRASAHDVAVCDAVATVVTGGSTDPLIPVSEDDVLKLERDACVRLAQTPETLARLKHLNDNGKPLRN